MSNINYPLDTENALQAKFRGRKSLKSRYVPKYPISAEREYGRLGRAYVGTARKAMKDKFPVILDAYRRELRKDSREDGVSDFLRMLHSHVLSAAAEMAEAAAIFKIETAVDRIGRMVQRLAIAEWTMAVKTTIGVDLNEDYYKGELYEQEIRRWAAENLVFMKDTPRDTLLDLERIIQDAYKAGTPVTELKKQLQKRYSAARHRANMIARDQVSTLNNRLVKMQHKDSGVRRYIWLSERDERVRECHKAFDGTIYSWDDPPEDWHRTADGMIVYTGKKHNPGEAYNCRCTAVPVFDVEEFKIPIVM